MTSPRISIALCTYNGAAYLEEQLSSFSAQTLTPFELVICDDLSTDNTADIVANFARRVQFPVHFHVNETRLGSTLNFGRAIDLCRGDIIALSDQDDVWREDKLMLLAGMLAIPGVVAAFSDAEVTDANLAPLGYTMWQRLSFKEREQSCMLNGHALNVLLKRYVVMGATLAFHADLRSLILPIPRDWHHDAWIVLIAASLGKFGLSAEALIKYRQHSRNQIGGRKSSLLRSLMNSLDVDRDGYLSGEVARWQALLNRVDGLTEGSHHPIEEKISHLKRRIGLPKRRAQRILGVIRETRCGGYRRYARNWGSIALDLLIK